VEHRCLESTTIRTQTQRWPGLRQGLRVRRHGLRDGKPYVEEVYGITSLSPAEADAALLLALVRAGWSIENQLHYRRDVTLGEDACPVSSGSAPQVLAALRNATVYLLTEVEADRYAAATRRRAARPTEAIHLLDPPM
jgi:predicted transposase YbfD/YdcC